MSRSPSKREGRILPLRTGSVRPWAGESALIVAVVAGGGPQHSASVESGRAVTAALSALGGRTTTVRPGARLYADLAESGARAVISASLDWPSADGTLHQLCADLGIAVLGASDAALRSCSDKATVHDRLAAAGLAVPDQRLCSRHAAGSIGLLDRIPAEVADLGEDVFVKPRHGSGGVGVKRVHGGRAAVRSLRSVLSDGDDAVLESAVQGEEFVVLMTGAPGEPMGIGISRVTYRDAETSAAAWARCHQAADELDPRVRRSIIETACRAAYVLGLDGLFTVDLILDATGTLWTIDVDGLVDWRAGRALDACLASSEITPPQLVANLLRDAGATMRRAA